MNLNEIFDYAAEGITWLTIGGISYISTLVGVSLIHGFSQRIRLQKELKKIIDEEATRLGLNPSKIDVEYNGKTTGVRKNGERYNLSLTTDWLLTRATIRHELYHIYKGHCEDRVRNENGILNEFDYFFRREPQALLYGSFKIKL